MLLSFASPRVFAVGDVDRRARRRRADDSLSGFLGGSTIYVGIAVLMVAVALLIYSWRDKAARWRYRAAGNVALGVYFGVQALIVYRDHSHSYLVALFAGCAVMLVATASWSLWRGK